MLTSYHVHSEFSDGRNTLVELVEGGLRAGLDEMGFSDHYVLLGGDRTVRWSMPLDALPRYFEGMRAASEAAEGKMIVRCGLEADFEPEAASELRDALRGFAFDYVIGSIHFIGGFAVDELKDNWDHLTERERNDMIREYWERIPLLARSGMFDIMGHLDLYKKFGYGPTVDMSAEIANALDAIAHAEMTVELNTSGWDKEVEEAYPSTSILRECRSRGIPIMLSADAHNAQDLTRNYDRAAALLRGIGWDSTVTYAQRTRRIVPLI